MLCVLLFEGMSVVVNGITDESVEPTPSLVQPVGAHGGDVSTFRVLRGELGFLNCDDI